MVIVVSSSSCSSLPSTLTDREKDVGSVLRMEIFKNASSGRFREARKAEGISTVMPSFSNKTVSGLVWSRSRRRIPEIVVEVSETCSSKGSEVWSEVAVS